jgi:hypothetical protein
MTTVQSWMAAMLCLGLSACSPTAGLGSEAIETQSSALSDEAKPTSTYYQVRRDMRRCMSPMCGGYFVTAVNQKRTRCADGKKAAECYVAELAQSAGTELTDGALVHGTLAQRSYPGIDGRWGVLKADFAAAPVLDVARAGEHLLAYDTGIRCITTPCPSLAVVKLNTRSPKENRPDVVFAADTAEENALLEQAFYNELGSSADSGSGALVVGQLSSRFDYRTRKSIQTLSVTNVYSVNSPTCLVLTNPPNTTAWNFSTRAEASAFANVLEGEVQLIEGACDEALIPCTAVYKPVHGQIDALGDACIGASNACGFRAAVINAAGHDSKASGSFVSGECPGDDEVIGCELIDCQPGDTCIEDAEGNGSCVFDACSLVRCAAGTHCELQQIQCITFPCDPIAECVADLECDGPVIDCAAPPPDCHYVDGGCVRGQWTCGHLVCDGSGL